MNELEKEIYKEGLNYTLNNADKFRQGCNFILEKNLPVLFGDWLNINFIWFGSHYWEKCNGSTYPKKVGTTQEIYDYWLNNVYGKEK